MGGGRVMTSNLAEFKYQRKPRVLNASARIGVEPQNHRIQPATPAPRAHLRPSLHSVIQARP